MSRRFFAQLFDAPAEIVVAHGRVVLAAISLAAITAQPTQPAAFAPLVSTTMLLYAAYAVALLAALQWRIIHNLNGAFVHSIDIGVIALLLFLTEGFSSPFLVFFTFVLLAASLRWDWQGIAFTMLALVALAFLVAVFDYGADGQLSNINQTVIRAAYLIATGTILAYASAHREHERARLNALAQWPPVGPAQDEAEVLGETLRRAAAVLEARSAVVIWDDGRQAKLAVWDGRECQIRLNPKRAPALAVAADIEGAVFSHTLPYLGRLNLINGSVRFVPEVLTGELVSTLPIDDFSSAPFQGTNVKGRLFVVGNIRRSDDHLLVTSIIADRVGAELDRQVFLRRAAEDAATRARSAIMRDLHDGLLQNLTAVRAQLELVSADEGSADGRLSTARELLRVEQQRLREFVDLSHVADTDSVALRSLRPLAEDTARFWDCVLSLTIDPETAEVPRRTINQLSLMLAESVANAVRHGGAGKIEARITHAEGRLEVDLRDDGGGFPGCLESREPLALGEAELPRSLSARVHEVGGRIQGWTCGSGSRLYLELPV